VRTAALRHRVDSLTPPVKRRVVQVGSTQRWQLHMIPATAAEEACGLRKSLDVQKIPDCLSVDGKTTRHGNQRALPVVKKSFTPAAGRQG
jgi:hypothetical protein